MASVDVSALSKAQKDELAVTYAALLLHDGELEITEEKLNKVISAAGVSVEGYWPGLFAKALRGKNIADLLSNAGSSASAAPVADAPVAAAPAKAAEAPKSKYITRSHNTNLWPS
jgi:large subunit ribosomal protein LP1